MKKLFETILYFRQKIKELNLDQYDKKLLDSFSKEFKDLIIT